jgi:predicted amidohydrolase YtcJ
MRFSLIFPLFFAIIFSNQSLAMKEKVDLLIINGRIYTVDSVFSIVEAVAVKDKKIVAIGSTKDLTERFHASETIDIKGTYAYPGFIDAHSHFYGYAVGLQYVDLNGARSFEEVISRISVKKVPAGQWVVGRGWDQNLWSSAQFPDYTQLNLLFPDNPVMLIRVDGHVVVANKVALDLAGIKDKGGFLPGEVEMKSGKLTGILSETAADRMRSIVPEPAGEELANLLSEAENRCFKAGLTSVCDAGLDYRQIKTLEALQGSGKLSIHLYIMLSPNTLNLTKLVIKGGYIKERMAVRSIKIYADGSLGSRTARLKQPYTDEPAHSGISVTQPDSIKKLCKLAYDNGYQVNIHCIGDSAVRTVLEIYAEFLKTKNDRRWRIEHAQVVDPADLHYFRDYSIVPSIQATHATSDMAWAGNRLGNERVKSAYAYKDLLMQNGWLPNGTDFPIENISPILTFYAAVSRKNQDGTPVNGFQTENALTREEALKSITIWAARGGFLDHNKGSIEVGKDADLVILNKDLLTIPIEEVPGISVEHTICMGKMVK